MRHENSFRGAENYTPMPGLVLVREDLLPETSEAGIIRPESYRVQITGPKTATVLSVHPESEIPSGVRVFICPMSNGMYPFRKDTAINARDMRHYFVREEDCLAIIED